MAYLITADQMRMIHALLNKMCWMDYKSQLVHTYGNGAASIKELTEPQARALLKYLKEEEAKFKSSIKLQQKKVYYLVGQLGWKTATGGLDFERLDAFLMAKGVVKKDMRKMSAAELTQTINQFEGLLKNNNNSAASKAVGELRRDLGV